jgi:hypothetical protein
MLIAAIVVISSFMALILDYSSLVYTQIMAVYISVIGYLLAFVTNTAFYMGSRHELLYSIYWSYDWLLGWILIAPFYVFSCASFFSDAHMRLLYNSQVRPSTVHPDTFC